MSNNLVLASGGSWDVTGLGVGFSGFHSGPLSLHGGEVDIRANWVLVALFSRVDSRGIGTVSLEGLEGVEVVRRAGGAGVPGLVDILLRGLVPELIVVLSVLEVERGNLTGAGGGGGEGNPARQGRKKVLLSSTAMRRGYR